MSAKQDRQGVRTAAQLEQKLNVSERFASIMGIATDARNAAEEAQRLIEQGLSQEEVFNILTNNGQSQGLYRGEDGALYINASYIVAGILKSLNAATQLNLDDGAFTCTDENGNAIKMEYGQFAMSTNGNLMLQIQNLGFGSTFVFWNPFTNTVEGSMGIDGMNGGFYIDCDKINPGKKVLFNGSANIGDSFEVPHTADYDLFAVFIGVPGTTFSTAVLCYKYAGVVHGVGGWGGNSTQTKELFYVSASFTGDTWTLEDATVQAVGSYNLEEPTKYYVKKVVGVI